MHFIRNLIVIVILVLIYRPWLDISKTLASGDWPYLFKETIENFSFSPDPLYFWLGPYYQITSKISVQYLHVPWEITEKIWWFWMPLVVSFFSSWYLSKTILKQSKFSFLSILIFLTNTYILMIAGGGQMGITLAYSFSPVVLGSFIEFIETLNYKINSKFIKFVFLLATLFMFDPRITYVMIFAFLIYLFVFLLTQKEFNKKIPSLLICIFTAGFFVLIFNSSWIMVRLLSKSSNFFTDFSSGSLESLKFFSFSTFSDSFSLLHPNWPENVFGKVYFMRSEFIILPILAYFSLFFTENFSLNLKAQNFKSDIAKEEFSNRTIIFFVLLGFLGAFLSKGSNPPIGELYEWMFKYFPGFIMFRDPTKFYILIVISYSILIPYSIEKIANKISFLKFGVSNIIYFAFIIVWCFTIRQSLLGVLNGTFISRSVPVEYIALKNFLLKDSKYSPVLWVPTHSPFTFYSKTHPFIDASYIFKSTKPSKITVYFNDKEQKHFIKEKKIKYIIVPKDMEGKIFLEDRKYNETEYKKTIESLRKISFLEPVNNFGEIMVFQVKE